MGIVILYLAVVVAGYAVGHRYKDSEKKFGWVGIVQLVVIILLVFTMGGRIGSNKNVVTSLDSIGLTALFLTIFILAGSVGAVFLARKLLGFDKEGNKSDD